MVQLEKMYQVFFTEEEYQALLAEYSQTQIMELSEFSTSIDRHDKDGWDGHRVDVNTLVALRRAELVELEVDLYEH